MSEEKGEYEKLVENNNIIQMPQKQQPSNSFSLFEKIFEGYNIRMFTLKDELYFVGKDIATALKYSNTAQAIRSNCDNRIQLADILGGAATQHPENSKEIKDLEALGLDPQTTIIDEGDLYALVLRCGKRDEAKVFRTWVSSVIKEIRKTGGYSLQQQNSNIDLLINEIKEIKNENQEIKNMIVRINSNKIDITKRFFTLQECCDYINDNYSFAKEIKTTPKMLKEFLKTIEVLKSNYKPRVPLKNKNYINDNLELSAFGLNYVIERAMTYIIK